MTTIEDVTITGDGSQNVFGNTVARDLILNQLTIVRGRPAMVLSEDEVAERVRAYIPAFNHGRIVEILAADHVIALAGPEGAGVVTTAIAALRRLHPALRIRFFSTGEDDVEEAAAASTPCGYLIRARDEEPSRLRSFLAAVRASNAFAVVVGTAAEQRHLTEFLTSVTVEPPPANAVYRSHLARRGLFDSPWQDWSGGTRLLWGASPGDAARLARIVYEVSRRGGDEHEVERAYLGWAEELRKWFGSHPGLLDQTLMIAAATITPADETQVYGAASSLARHLEITLAGGGLAWTPTTGLSELLDAERDEDQIVFRRYGYAESLLPHVFAEYPLARMELLSWLAKLPTDTVLALERTLGHRLVRTFADLAARYNKYEKITQMARAWATGSAADLAYIALTQTCLHPLVGGRVRTKLYEWSRERQAPQSLKLTVVQVCEVLGQTHLSIAMTRLKHLATHGDERVRLEVLDVARALADLDPAAVFSTALKWAASTAQGTGADMIGRLDVAMRLLLDLLPSFGGPELRQVLETVDHLVTNGTPQLRSRLLGWARELAAGYPVHVLILALSLTRNDIPSVRQRTTFGTDLFLTLTVSLDFEEHSSVLEMSGPVDPMSCTLAWRAAFAATREFPHFGEALRVWLDTAAAREDLRTALVSALTDAAHPSPASRQLLTDVVRSWAAAGPGRRTVREAILTRVLLPEWRRWLLLAWVRLRPTIL
ncbi:hypothetical protein [Streptosporangium sp. NPDC020145]|uniref:Uncharacterized protein n=1 Tax=Streptosporangium jomthongense TaxID=1193683 RepID=A0ABV8ET58_9ACTN